MEAVVDEALGDVVHGDPGALLDRPQVEDAFVRDEASRPRIEHRVVPIISMYIQEIGRIDALPKGAADTAPMASVERSMR